MGLFAGVAAGVARRVTCSQKLYQMKLEFSRTFESEELTGTVTRLSSSVCVTHLQHKPTHPVPTTFRQVATPSHPLQSRNVFGGNGVAVQVPMPANRANQRCLLRGTLNAFAAALMPGLHRPLARPATHDRYPRRRRTRRSRPRTDPVDSHSGACRPLMIGRHHVMNQHFAMDRILAPGCYAQQRRRSEIFRDARCNRPAPMAASPA